MRHAAASATLLGSLVVSGSLAVALSLLSGSARAEYYCSPGFEPISGGRCIATVSRSEVDLYLNDPVYDETPRVRRHYRRHRHHTVHARY